MNFKSNRMIEWFASGFKLLTYMSVLAASVCVICYLAPRFYSQDKHEEQVDTMVDGLEVDETGVGYLANLCDSEGLDCRPILYRPFGSPIAFD